MGSPALESKKATGIKSQIILAIIRTVEYNELTDFFKSMLILYFIKRNWIWLSIPITIVVDLLV